MCDSCCTPPASGPLKLFRIDLTLAVWASSKEDAERLLIDRLKPVAGVKVNR